MSQKECRNYAASGVSQTPNCNYNGEEQTPAVVVKNAKGKVIPADNYDVAYANNTNAGTGTVTVTAKGSNFITSSKDGSFTINPASLANASVSLNDYIHTHTGSTIEPPPIVKYNGTLLEKDTDYTVAYSDNINVGLATITVTGKGNYTGTLTQNFFIKQNDAIDENIDLSKATVTLSADSYTYDGTEKTPEVTVKSKNGVLLTEGTHYRTVYFNNTDAGTAGVVIVPAANSEYKVGNTKNFTINKLDLSEGAVRMSLDQTLYKRDYANKEPVVTVTYQGKPIDSTNYTVTYTDNVYGPDAKATVTGAVNCTGMRELPFTIYAENDISYGDVSVSPGAYTYDGTEKKPKVTVKLDGQTLQENHDYTVEYSNNVKVGTVHRNKDGDIHHQKLRRKRRQLLLRRFLRFVFGKRLGQQFQQLQQLRLVLSCQNLQGGQQGNQGGLYQADQEERPLRYVPDEQQDQKGKGAGCGEDRQEDLQGDGGFHLRFP